MNNLDYTKYLGVPFKFNGNTIKEGFDCINLCVAVARDRGIPMANVNHIDLDLSTAHTKFETMAEQPKLWQKVEQQPDTLVVFKINGKISHVGYMLDKFNFIHITEGARVTVEKITTPQWNKRIFGYYKYIGTELEV